jgi:predicted transcriptional regulator
MIMNNNNAHQINNNLHLIFSLLLALVFFILIIIFLSSQSAEAGTPIGFASDEAPPVVNESSEPVVVMNITIWDADSPMLMSINITIQNLSTFQPDLDLTPLSGDETSGVMLYKETNGIPDFQFDDTPIGVTPTPWLITGPGKWQSNFLGIDDVLTPPLNFYYVVIRTNSSISDNEAFMVGILQNHVVTDHGNLPALADNWTSPIDVDTEDPVPVVNLESDDTVIKIGDWVNITAEVMDINITSVTVDLSDFNGLSKTEPMIYDTDTKVWFYNLTNVMEGTVDTSTFGYPFTVTATDLAKNQGTGINSTHRVDTITPGAQVMVSQERIPAGIGHWINISVTTDSDVVTVEGDLSALAGFGPSEPFSGSGGNWWFNFTVNPGTLDGPGPIRIMVTDDTGHTDLNDTQQVLVDEGIPSLGISFSQSATPAGIGDWINITVISDPDVTEVFADLASAGFAGQVDGQPLIWSGIDWYYQLIVTSGTFDGSSTINLNALDDVKNQGTNSSQSIEWDETAPQISVSVLQGSTPAGIGEWMNITVTVDADVVSVAADLDAAGITGQVDGQSLTKIDSITWFYNFTIVQGSMDSPIPVSLDITAVDDASNSNSSSENVQFDEVYPEPLNVNVIHESGGTNPARAGDWINISIDMGGHMDISSMILDAPGIFASEPITQSWGNIWYLNTTVPLGSADGLVSLTVTVLDDAGNLNDSKSADADVDNQPPSLAGIQSVSDGVHITPDNVFEGSLAINATIDATDIVKVSFYDGDPSGSGVLLGDDLDHPYQSIWITEENDNGVHELYVRVFDDAGNFIDSSPFSIVVLNFDDLPVSVINWNHRAPLVDLTIYLAGDRQNTLSWEIYQGTNLLSQDSMTKGTGPVEMENLDIQMDLSSDYEILLMYPPTNVGKNSMTLTFEINGMVYSLFHEFDSQDLTTHQLQVPLKEIFEPMGIITLDGSGSYDLDSNIVHYDWYIDGTIVGSGPQLTYLFSGNGNYEIILEVTSDDSQTNQSSIALEIENYKNGAGREDIISEMAALTYLKNTGMNALFLESETAEILVYDSLGNRIGVADGEFVNEISQAQTVFNLGSTRTYFIPKEHDLTCEVTGLEDGNYDLGFLTSHNGYLKMSYFFSHLNQSDTDTYFFKGDLKTFNLNTHREIMTYSLSLKNRTNEMEKTFEITDIELGPEDVHEYEVVDWGTIDEKKGAVKLKIDENEDGGYEYELDLENGMTGLDVKNSLLVKPGKSPVGLPFELILLFGFVVTLSAAGVLFLLTEVGKVALFYYVFLLYTRIKKEYVLDNFTRGEIFGYIKANPGVHFSEIKRALELKNGSLAYHIKTLEKRELIVSRRDRGYKRFYPKTMKLPERNIRELIPVQRNIMHIVKDSPGISQTAIAEKLDISFQLVHYHVKILRDSEYLILEKDGKQTYCYDKDALKKGKDNT